MRCKEARLGFLDLLRERVSPDRWAEVEAHMAECPSCARELDSLRDAWNRLPTPDMAIPPPAARASALAYARRPGKQTESALQELWGAVREVAVPATLGAVVAAALVLLMHVRGAMAPLSHPAVVTVSLALAASLALVAGGLWRSVTPKTVRAILLGSIGAFGGYFLLTVISPISDTVQVCRLALFRDVPMSLGEICLVYLAVALLYAGVPMGVAAYVRGARHTWRAGLVEAAIFALVVAPTAILQLGLEEWFITLTVLAGLTAGGFVGGLGGTWIRFRRMAGATG